MKPIRPACPNLFSELADAFLPLIVIPEGNLLLFPTLHSYEEYQGQR